MQKAILHVCANLILLCTVCVQRKQKLCTSLGGEYFLSIVVLEQQFITVYRNSLTFHMSLL